MALAPCRECGETVSNTAATCPHCGVRHPDERRATAKTPGILLVIAVSAVVLLGLYLLTEWLAV